MQYRTGANIRKSLRGGTFSIGNKPMERMPVLQIKPLSLKPCVDLCTSGVKYALCAWIIIAFLCRARSQFLCYHLCMPRFTHIGVRRTLMEAPIEETLAVVSP